MVVPETAPTVTPTPVALPAAAATSSVGTATTDTQRAAGVPLHVDDYDDVSDEFRGPVGLPLLRVTDLLEAASRIPFSQTGAVAQRLARLHYTAHPPEVLQDFLILSVATRLRVYERLMERLTQYRLTGTSSDDIIVVLINFLRHNYTEGSRR